jgi:hypothetical protein
MSKWQHSKRCYDGVWDVRILGFEIVSDFVLRISDLSSSVGGQDNEPIEDQCVGGDADEEPN